MYFLVEGITLDDAIIHLHDSDRNRYIIGKYATKEEAEFWRNSVNCSSWVIEVFK